MRVSVSVECAVGHRLLGYDGLCSNLHGHNYIFEVEINGNPDSLGLVVDFKKLKAEVKRFLEQLDHAMVLCKDDPAVDYLRSSGDKLVVLSQNPSAENLASLLFNHVVTAGYPAHEARVRETNTSVAVAHAVDRKVLVTYRQKGMV